MEQRYLERERTTSSSYAADYVSHFLYGGNVLGAEADYAMYRDLIPQIGVREVNAVVRGWTAANDRVILVSAPERPGAAPPSEEALAEVVRRAGGGRIAPYRDQLADAPLVRELPRPGAIVGEREVAAIGAVEWQLSNGSTIFLKPTDFREDEVLFAARSPGGTSLVDDEDFVYALTAAAVVQSGGVGDLSATDLRKHLAGSLAGVGADIGEHYEGLSGAASPRDLETLFQLAYLKFTAPRVDSAAFLAYREQATASLANRSASPEVAFRDTLRLTLAQYHPRARPPSVEMFASLDLERSFEIYRDRFADASDFTFFLVGRFDLDEVRPLVEQYIASLPDLGRVEQPRDVGIRTPPGVVRRTVRQGIEPRAATQIVFSGDFEFERANVLAIQTLADVLRIRLRDTLREELGGTYGVEVRGAGVPEPYPHFQFALGFGADPHRIDELVSAVFAEIEQLRSEGPLESDLARVREMQFRSRESELRQNQFWIGQMLIYNQYGWDLADIPATANRVSSVTPEMIRNAARTYLDPERYVQVTLLPETGGV
jgi:zinc protease